MKAMARSTYLMPMLLGAATGVIVGLLVWKYAEKKLNDSLSAGESQLARELSTGIRQVRGQANAGRAQVQAAIAAAIREQVLPAVKAQVTTSITRAGVTPALIADVKQAIDLARRARVLT